MTPDYDYIPSFIKEEDVRVVKQKKTRRKRNGISPKQIRVAIDVLRDGVEPQVVFSFDELKMAKNAVEYCRTAMFRAMEILEGKPK